MVLIYYIIAVFLSNNVFKNIIKNILQTPNFWAVVYLKATNNI